ncbi:MAG: DUF4469 domain-containing protein [Treponema sp.]|jgi:hypothetical protein|nr:DUF4469 domain-containing protein [Treponema sp.]
MRPRDSNRNNLPLRGVYKECLSFFDPSQLYKVKWNFLVNTSRKVAGIVPALPAGEYMVEAVTQSTGNGINLKKPRTVKSWFTLGACRA